MLLPDGILDFSDDLSQEDDDLLHDDGKDLKSKRRQETHREAEEAKVELKDEPDPSKAKLRIKTGGMGPLLDLSSTGKCFRLYSNLNSQ